MIEFAEEKGIYIPSNGKASIGVEICATEMTCIKNIEITIEQLKRIDSNPIPVADEIVYLSVHNTSDKMVSYCHFFQHNKNEVLHQIKVI